MARRSLIDEIADLAMARNYCRLAGTDPDELVAGYIIDAAGREHWVRKARWRWYRAIAEVAPAEGVAVQGNHRPTPH